MAQSGPAKTTESQFQGQVIELAHILGWTVAHFRPARTERGWRTAVAADGAGYPDLTMVRERLVFAELKSDRGLASEAQRDWHTKLVIANVETYLWRPADWVEIVSTLTRRVVA